MFVEYPVDQPYPGGLYIALIAVSLLLAFLFAYYRDQSKKILESAFNKRAKGSLSRADSEIIKKVSRYMNGLFFANALLFAYAVNLKFKVFERLSWHQYLAGGTVILLVFLLKYALQKFLAIVFRTKQESNDYMEDSYLKFKLYGVFLFPLLLLVLFSTTFSEIALYIGLFGFLFIWLLKSYYGLKLGLVSKSFPKHYSFLYICTLEILPLVLLWKIFKEPINTLLGI